MRQDPVSTRREQGLQITSWVRGRAYCLLSHGTLPPQASGCWASGLPHTPNLHPTSQRLLRYSEREQTRVQWSPYLQERPILGCVEVAGSASQTWGQTNPQLAQNLRNTTGFSYLGFPGEGFWPQFSLFLQKWNESFFSFFWWGV